MRMGAGCVLCDGRALPPPTRHQDRLAPVAEASIGRGLEEVFQVCLVRGRQPDASHLVQPPCIRNCPRVYLKKEAKSSAACIRTTVTSPMCRRHRCVLYTQKGLQP